MEKNEEYGEGSAEGRFACKRMHEADSLNLILVEKILDERGWPGIDEVDSWGNTAIWLVIQHSGLHVQEKYLPVMQEAVRNGKALPCHLALLEDRIAVQQGKNQRYGSQIGSDPETGEWIVSGLENPDSVNVWRLDAGLDKLEEYVSQWGVTWNPEEYKKKLSEEETGQTK